MGHGVPPSATKAIARLIEASDQEHPTAKVCLAIHHLTGRLVSFSEAKAKDLLFGTKNPYGMQLVQMIKSLEEGTDAGLRSPVYASIAEPGGLAEIIDCPLNTETE